MTHDRQGDIAREAEIISRLARTWARITAGTEELREVLAQTISGQDGGFAAFSIPGWPQWPSLRDEVSQWLRDSAEQDGDTNPALTAHFAAGSQVLSVEAIHIIDDYWWVMGRLAYPEGNEQGDGEVTACAVVRTGRAGRPLGSGEDHEPIGRYGNEAGTRVLRYKHWDDEHGTALQVGLPPEFHQVADMLSLEDDLEAQIIVARTLRRRGAPAQAADYKRWLYAVKDEAGWLWISFHTDRR